MVGPCHATRQVSPVHTGKDFSNASSWKVKLQFQSFLKEMWLNTPSISVLWLPRPYCSRGSDLPELPGTRAVLSHQISIQVASINISTEFIFFNFLWPSLRICWLGDWRPVCPKMDNTFSHLINYYTCVIKPALIKRWQGNWYCSLDRTLIPSQHSVPINGILPSCSPAHHLECYSLLPLQHLCD